MFSPILSKVALCFLYSLTFFFSSILIFKILLIMHIYLLMPNINSKGGTN